MTFLTYTIKQVENQKEANQVHELFKKNIAHGIELISENDWSNCLIAIEGAEKRLVAAAYYKLSNNGNYNLPYGYKENDIVCLEHIASETKGFGSILLEEVAKTGKRNGKKVMRVMPLSESYWVQEKGFKRIPNTSFCYKELDEILNKVESPERFKKAV